jgi:hypothetical protein
MRRRRQRRPALLLGLVLLAACNGQRDAATTPSEAFPHPVVVVGVDGFEWNVALPLIREGRLPHFQELAARGRAGRLDTLTPTVSPAIWTTVATGMPPAKHGIRGFAYRGKEGTELYTSRDRRVRTLWDIAGDAGLRSLVIGWWATFPVEPTPGVVVAQVNLLPSIRRQKGETLKGGPRIGEAGQVWPAERQEELLAIVEAVEDEMPEIAARFTGGDAFEDDPVVSRFWKESLWSLRADLAYTRMAVHLLETDPDAKLIAVYTGLTDVIAHRFWRWAFPEDFAEPPSARNVERYGSLIAKAYEHADRALGRLVAAAPAEAVFVVLSDHGMVADRTETAAPTDAASLRVSAAHHDAPPGALIVAGPGIAGGGFEASQAADALPVLGSVTDIAPTVLALLGLPAGADMPGRVLEELLEPGFLRAHPPSRIKTHSPAGWQRGRVFAATRVPGSEERLDQLRALGYLD